MKNKKKTIADLEAEQGAPDALRKLSGKNPRSDMHVDNFKHELDALVPRLVKPDIMPVTIEVHYEAGHTLIMDKNALTKAAIMLHAMGLI